ncbi:MAG: hypothetical protein ACK5PQ_02310 [Alphaproteobacteria bacterium]
MSLTKIPAFLVLAFSLHSGAACNPNTASTCDHLRMGPVHPPSTINCPFKMHTAPTALMHFKDPKTYKETSHFTSPAKIKAFLSAMNQDIQKAAQQQKERDAEVQAGQASSSSSPSFKDVATVHGEWNDRLEKVLALLKEHQQKFALQQPHKKLSQIPEDESEYELPFIPQPSNSGEVDLLSYDEMQRKASLIPFKGSVDFNGLASSLPLLSPEKKAASLEISPAEWAKKQMETWGIWNNTGEKPTAQGSSALSSAMGSPSRSTDERSDPGSPISREGSCPFLTARDHAKTHADIMQDVEETLLSLVPHQDESQI